MTTYKCRLFQLLIALCILFPGTGISQMILPPYQLTVYDSSVTGYYFFAMKKMGQNQAGYLNTHVVTDELGNVIYYKPQRAVDFSMQPNGKVTYYRNQKFIILDSTFTPVDSVACLGYRTDAHEFLILSNNNYLLLGQQDSIMDLSSYNYFKKNGTPGSTTALVTGLVIQELDQNKNLVFEWRGLDHLPFSSVNPFWLNSPDTVDWSHSNALEIDADGNILLSSRHLCEITKINRTTGTVMWRMGGNYNEFTFVNDPFAFRGQHDIRRMANGNLTLLDNGWYSTPHEARGVEYQVDQLNKIATLVWSYAYDTALSSKATGNSQRTSQSLNLVNIGHREYGNHSFSLVDSLNNMISELSFFDSTVIYRAFFYHTLPWSFHRPKIACDIQGINVYLKTTETYSSYLWSDGNTTESILITAPGTYSVLVNYGEGFVTSEEFEVLNMNNPCYPVPTAEFVANSTSVCKNATVHFTDQSANNPASLQWSFPGGTPSGSTLQNPDVQYMTAGTYSVTLIAGNAYGNGSITKTNYLTVNTSPSASVTAGGPLGFCNGGSVLLSANTGTGLSYQWKRNGNNISGANTSTYSVTSAAAYKVLVTNQSGCTKNSNSLTITGPPSNVITTTGSLDLCPGDSVKFEVPFAAGNTYQWKKNNTDISGATQNFYVTYTAGDYKVRITNSFGCIRLSVVKTVTTNCRLENASAENAEQVKIFPNPAPEFFNVMLDRNLSYEIILYDLAGKKIENYAVTNTDNFIFGINIEAGFYLCEIFYDNKKDLFKVVKAGR